MTSLAKSILIALLAGLLGAVPLSVVAQSQDARNPGFGERRIALVIGNAAYPDSPLPNPVADAKAVAASLLALGFDVDLVENLGRSEFSVALGRFRDRLKGPRTVGLFYFAGHGVQATRRNFLLPVDVRMQTEDDVPRAAIDLQVVLRTMESANPGLNVVVLDACRNNPFVSSINGLSNGFAEIDGPLNSIIAYSTAPGKVAFDGPAGGNSIFTKHLVANLGTSGLPVDRLFRVVRAAVVKETNDTQRPWENSSLMTEDFYFAPAKSGEVSPHAELPKAESAAWMLAVASDNLFEYLEFLRRFPKSQLRKQTLEKVNLVLKKLSAPAIEESEVETFIDSGYTGFWFREINSFAAKYLGLESPHGVMIVEVQPGSIAALAGLRSGDVLLEVNGRPIRGVEDLRNLTRDIRAGDFVEGKVFRNRTTEFVSGMVGRAGIDVLYGRAVTRPGVSPDRARLLLEYLSKRSDRHKAQLGSALIYGRGGAKDIERGIALLRESYNRSGDAALVLAAAAQIDHPGSVFANDAEAVSALERLGQGAIPEAALLVAYMAVLNRAPQISPQIARLRAEFAANMGQPVAQALFALMWASGYGGPTDSGQARQWCVDAVKESARVPSAKSTVDRICASAK